MPKSAGKQMSINIIASIVSFAVTVGINFFLTPYLVKEVGSDAYGFIGLANNFVQYATIVTTALNQFQADLFQLHTIRAMLRNHQKYSVRFSLPICSSLQ